MKRKPLLIAADLYGCPNRCLHCWLGHMPNRRMEEDADRFIMDYFDPYFERIAFYSDAHVPDCWTEFTSGRYARPRSLTRKWSDLRSINYYLGRNFKRTRSLDEYQQQFGTKDWNAFSRDQLIFAGNKLHLCLY